MNNKKNAAPKAAKQDLYDNLPTQMQHKTDLPKIVIDHFKEHKLAYKWLNSTVMAKNNNVHHAQYLVWTPPETIRKELEAKGVPFASDGTLRKGGDLVLGIQKESVRDERRAHLAKKNKALAGYVENKKREFKEMVYSEGIGTDVDLDYGNE
jgi:hypothetical protein